MKIPESNNLRKHRVNASGASSSAHLREFGEVNQANNPIEVSRMKHYDFEPDEQMSAVIGLLHSMVIYNYQRLKRLVGGLTQEAIDYKGTNNELNSIAHSCLGI